MKFSEFIADHEFGIIDEKAAVELRDLFAACAREQRSGTLTIKVRVTPEHDAYRVGVDIDCKAPETPTRARLYWTDLDGNPSQRNPIQPTMTTPDGQEPGTFRVGPASSVDPEGTTR